MVIGNWQLERLFDGDKYVLKPRDDIHGIAEINIKPGQRDWMVYGPPVVVELANWQITHPNNQRMLDGVYLEAQKELHNRELDRRKKPTSKDEL